MSDDPLSLDRQLCFAVYSTAHSFNRLYKPLLDALGLTYPQYLVMLVLWEGDGLIVKALGERLSLDSGTLTPLLKRLEAMDLVERRRDEYDERQVRIRLTEKGRELKAEAARVPVEVGCAVGLERADFEAMLAGLLALRGRLQTATGDA